MPIKPVLIKNKLWYTDNVIIMKDNKGFTLIELIVTIGILAMLSLVVGMSITNMIEKQNERNYNEFVKEVEDAACVYAEKLDRCKSLTNCSITFEELLAEGLIDKDLINLDVDKNPEKYKDLINLNVDKKLKEYTVSDTPNEEVDVRWENYEKICKYVE